TTTANAAPAFRAAAVLPNAITGITVSPGAITNTACPAGSSASPDLVTVSVSFTVPAGAVAGDTFTLNLPPTLQIGYDYFGLLVPNTSPPAYMGVVEVLNNVATFTLNDYVQTHANITGSAYFYSGRCW
ncbi:unnamed protein product, partial [Phaeothamnion confervicola]